MINKKIQDFYDDASSYFEEGYFKEIYSSGKFCIVNACDLTYVLFNYMKDDNGNQIGVQMAADEMKVVVTEEHGYDFFIAYLQQNFEDFKVRVFILNEPTRDMMKRFKEGSIPNDNSEVIDAGIEAEIHALSKGYGDRLLDRGKNEDNKQS